MKKFLYWLLSFTWGLPLTFVGSIIALILLCGGKKPHKFGWNYYFVVGENWGGLEFGPFFLIDSKEFYSTKCHEHGHGLQNIIWGPLFPLVVSLRSGARYWLREMTTYNRKKVYCLIVALISLVISGGIFTAGVTTDMLALLIVGVLLVTYFAWFNCWLSFWECPKYKDGLKEPDYDDFWVEGQASRWGEAFMKKLESQNEELRR